MPHEELFQMDSDEGVLMQRLDCIDVTSAVT